MRLVAIASSSSGNAYLLVKGGDALLVDCGVSRRSLVKAFAGACVDVSSLAGILLTHNHTDHISGLKSFLDTVDVPVFANAMTAEAAAEQAGVGIEKFAIFENGQEFQAGDFTVTPFSVPHDTVDPVGFLVEHSGSSYFHATDVGSPLDSIGRFFSRAEIATLESNHDTEMLFQSGRGTALIQRISGPRGHLSNEEAAEFVGRHATSALKRLFLAHLSHDCNDPLLAHKTMSRTLRGIGRDDVLLEVIN